MGVRLLIYHYQEIDFVYVDLILKNNRVIVALKYTKQFPVIQEQRKEQTANAMDLLPDT